MPACINKHSEPDKKNEINNTLSLTKTPPERNSLHPDIQLLIMNIRKLVWNLTRRWAEIILQILESKYSFYIHLIYFIFLDNPLFLTQERLKKKLLIVNMENIWAEAILQLELELQLLIKKQIIEIILWVDTAEAEKLVALISLSDIHIQKHCCQDIKKTSSKSLRIQSFWKMERLST